MGNNSLATINNNDISDVSNINQFKESLTDELLPRNSGGVPTDLAGSLGSSEIKWIRANIAKGYWSPGDIKAHHTYDGSLPIDNGWLPCDGTIINETNYNAIHGAGSWATYILVSPLDGKYSPNLVGKYIGGAASTTQSGTTPITSTGNASNQINVAHTHPGIDHNHKWYQKGTSSGAAVATAISSNGAKTYNSSGTQIDLPSNGIPSQINPINADCYTNNASAGAQTELSTTQSIQPQSVKVVFYIRII